MALASSLSFSAAGGVDAVVYGALQRHGRPTQIHGSNLVGAIVDSVLFPLMAFGGPLSGPLVLGQILAKVGGGALWAGLLSTFRSPG